MLFDDQDGHWLLVRVIIYSRCARACCFANGRAVCVRLLNWFVHMRLCELSFVGDSCGNSTDVIHKFLLGASSTFVRIA